MNAWDGHLCAGIRLAVAVLAAALGAASVGLAGDALSFSATAAAVAQRLFA